jgi:hypothetical protein
MSPCTDTNENHDRKLTTEKLDRTTRKQKKKGKKKKRKGGKTFVLLSFFRSSFFFFLNKDPNNNRLETRGKKALQNKKLRNKTQKSKDMKPRVQMKTNSKTPPVFSLSLSLSLSHTHKHTQSHNAHHCPRRAKASKRKKKETLGPGAKFKQPIQNNKGWVCHTDYSLAIYILKKVP